jgi:hypothetical protein
LTPLQVETAVISAVELVRSKKSEVVNIKASLDSKKISKFEFFTKVEDVVGNDKFEEIMKDALLKKKKKKHVLKKVA